MTDVQLVMGVKRRKYEFAARRTILIATEVNRSPYPTATPKNDRENVHQRRDCLWTTQVRLLRPSFGFLCCRYCPFVID